jgi:GT2 family glycosyltransferase
MVATRPDGNWRVDGRFFRCGAARVRPVAVTYGPFPGGWPADFGPDFRRIADAGFNSVRLFEMPDRRLLDAALESALMVFGGLQWGQHADFLGNPALLSSARVSLAESLRRIGRHPALAGIYVANEIPPELARWMEPTRVLDAIEELIALGRRHAPHLLFAYANFPSTEYLEPRNADFTAFNVYLEDPAAFRAYLKRLHHIAGDRPLVISEFGMDSRRNGPERQATTLAWAARIAAEEETAGFTVYAWSDRWWCGGAEVTDWDFGLLDRAGEPKPALAAVSAALRDTPASKPAPDFSVIVCTRNGRDRIGRCLRSIAALRAAPFETIVVDDGSTDGTADYVRKNFPWAQLLRLPPCGLGAARNAGAAAAGGTILAFTDDDCEPDAEWLLVLARTYRAGRFAAAGGPNLPPTPQSFAEAVVCAAPGAPCHVMLDDEEAEHLPGCNLSVTRAAFENIGGFDPRFHTAGDDVDFCWRLLDAGHRLGFAPGAFVWHQRRPSIRGFLSQQAGYGRAERLLIEKHPHRFNPDGGTKWRGFVYLGGPVRAGRNSIIYHGPMGSAGYQSITNRMPPLRGLHPRFHTSAATILLEIITIVAPALRAWHRNRRLALPWPRLAKVRRPAGREQVLPGPRETHLERLLAAGWKPGGPTASWDLENGNRRILLATEHLPDFPCHTLVREWEE